MVIRHTDSIPVTLITLIRSLARPRTRHYSSSGSAKSASPSKSIPERGFRAETDYVISPSDE
jgi:hypothetical protein